MFYETQFLQFFISVIRSHPQENRFNSPAIHCIHHWFFASHPNSETVCLSTKNKILRVAWFDGLPSFEGGIWLMWNLSQKPSQKLSKTMRKTMRKTKFSFSHVFLLKMPWICLDPDNTYSL